MMLRLVTLLLLLIPLVARGQTMNDRAAADENRRWLARQFAAKRAVTLPAGTLYVNGTVVLAPTVGCGRLDTAGAGGDSVGEHPTLAGCRTRVVQLGRGPILRLAGSGFIGVEPLEVVGDGVSAAIEVEGRSAPATGRHRFRNWVFRDWGQAFRALGGYHNATGQFVAHEAHADNCLVEGCETFNVGTLFRSENQQALNWVFRDCVVNGLGKANYPRHIVADLVRGGCVTLERLVIEEWQATLFRVADWSPNNCRLVARDVFYDRMLAPRAGLRVVEYAGRAETANYSDWSLRVDGWSGMPLDPNELYRVPGDLPRGRWCVELEGAAN